MSNKIVDMPELLARVAAAREAGHTIVHGHGCFDIVHPGHVRYLEFARRQGDLLVVSVTGDAQITKGERRPYIPQELRAENLAALEAVDLVYIDPHPTAGELLRQVRPDLYVKGHEYEHNNDPDFAAERAIVQSYGGRVLFSSGDIVYSSGRLIEAMGQDLGSPQARSLEAERLRLFCGRYGITHESLETLISAFAGLRVLVVGDVILDRYVLCDATDLASEAPMMSLSRLEERVFVGGAGVVARHLAGLGAQTYLLSTAADDQPSTIAQQTFEKDAICAKLILARSRLPEKTRYLVESTKLLRVEDAQCTPLDSRAETEAAEWVEAIDEELNAVIFCDFGYGVITGGLLARLRRILGRSSPIVAADVSGPRGQLLQFHGATLLCPTEREVRAALHDFESGLSNVVWNALDQTQSQHMLVTMNKKGLVVFDRQSQDPASTGWRGRLRSEYLPSLAQRVVDPLGCGDALLAAATLVTAGGGSLMHAAYLGAVAAAIEAGQLGNIPIDLGTLCQYIDTRQELIGARASAEDQDAPAPGDADAEPSTSLPHDDVLERLAGRRAGAEDWRPHIPGARRHPQHRPVPPARVS